MFEFSYDSLGNCFQYEYKKEDKAGIPLLIYEKNRQNDFSPCTNAYLKYVKYGNKVHFDASEIDFSNWENFLSSIVYLLELVMDYGEHDLLNPQPGDANVWLSRQDSFSDYRAGFEIRTYRLCSRMLMFHNFSELGTEPCLVSSLDFTYTETPSFTFLSAATQKGYIRKADGTYSVKALPAAEFTYQQLNWNTEVKSLPADSLDNLPTGIDTMVYQFTDLYKEGISGILTEQTGNWYYKANAGGGNFSPAQLVASKPSFRGFSTGMLQLQDLEASGGQFLVSMDMRGYFELDGDKQWLPFKTFDEVPNINMHDPNLKFLDLNGDGKLDILVSEDEVFTWYASKGKEGFDDAQTVRKSIDEERGPNIVFADSTQSITLADMNGDGKKDIVRVRRSEVVYWPNLGYGKFGAKITMGNSPIFDTPENFSPHYVKLADIDGSGTNDIVYLGHDSFQVYFNQAGNSLSTQNIINGVNPLPFPQMDFYSNISVVDLLGSGTGCIVWSSAMPRYAANPLYYIDLMGGKKPYIMTAAKNNMGSETNIQYQPSTFFYLQDKQAGTPWVTNLPFPVHCVSQVEMLDQVSKTRFTNQYTYHHGYYDQVEREFRGFGRVDQTDTEVFENYQKNSAPDGSIQLVDEGLHQPPVLTKTWFHTGAFLDKDKILNQFAHEYFANTVIPENIIPDPPLPPTLTVDELREAFRACKGIPLRTEVYAQDGGSLQGLPYTTASHSWLVEMLQPQSQNPYGVFRTQHSESLTYTYERNPADPRITHAMTLATDTYGNVLQAAAISYGRKTIDTNLTADEAAVQGKTHILFAQNNFTNVIDSSAAYHLPLNYESLSWELTGITPLSGDYFSTNDITGSFNVATAIDYDALPTAGKQEKRLLKQSQGLFMKDDLSAPLALGVIESLAIPYQSYKLALTPGMVTNVFGDKINNSILLNEGKYVNFNDGNYWIASGTKTLDAANFYQVEAVTDPFGFSTHIVYDSTYRFFIQQKTDALGNTDNVTGFNYRTLSPFLMQDINDNLSGVRTDELGMVVATFIMGKAGENKGDLMDVSTTEASPNDHPGSVMEYDLSVYGATGNPNFIKTTVNETHYFDTLQTGKQSLTQLSYAYTTGSGSIFMQKKQAEPGLALQETEDGTVTQVDTTPNLRWIGNGRTILNNKGKPVKQYEPYFSTTSDFEDSKELVERGVTPVIFYDSMGRPITTDLPDGTFTTVEYDAWMLRSSDQNDNVLASKWYSDRILAPVPAIATPEEIDAAKKAAVHFNTPSLRYFDATGQPFLGIADNGANGRYKTTTQTDIEGNVRTVTDARSNILEQYTYDMLGAKLYSLSMDAGERWTLKDVVGKPLRIFDSRGHVFRYESDSLHRPIKVFMQSGTAAEINTEKFTYGEGIANDKSLNLRGKTYQHFSTAGISTSISADFKGNLLQGSLQLCTNYKNDIDWNANPALDTNLFTSSSAFDALNRAVSVTSPDESVYTPAYNEAGFLNSVDINLKGAAEKTNFLSEISYDVKGRRETISYGNNTKTNYQYHPQTFRLIQILTTGKNGTDLLQKLSYTYDPVGNITTIKDEAQQTIFFNNSVVDPSNSFVYDAIYRLLSATGREHIGQTLPSSNDSLNINLPQPGDGTAMRNYTQSYQYDEVGNILQMIHSAGTGSWTRTYTPDTASNRLLSNTVSNTTETFTYDAHGNIQNLAQLQGITWNFMDRMQQANLGGGGVAYYVYDSGGQRSRKVIERLDGTKEQRIYVGGFELYQLMNAAGSVTEQTETLHVMDDTQRVAIVETKTIENSAATTNRLIRYQYNNCLDSATLELDGNAAIISYEEYYPFGTTSYQAINAAVTAAAKRYRYTGMERDDESGLAYHGARYYLPWLGRWLSADPIGIRGGLNVYAYVGGNPVNAKDSSGHAPDFDSFNKNADTNKDNKISSTELDAALDSSKITEGEWSAYMAAHPGAYQVDTAVGARIAKNSGIALSTDDMLKEYKKAQADKENQQTIGDGTMIFTFNAGTALQYTEELPSIGTVAQIKQYQKDRAAAQVLTPLLGFNILNSSGGGGEGGAGEGAEIGGHAEIAHGAPLEPTTTGNGGGGKPEGPSLWAKGTDTPRPPVLPEATAAGEPGKPGKSGGKSGLKLPSVPENPTVKVATDGVRETEVKSGQSVHNTKAVDQWDLFLGKGYTDINPFTGQSDPGRMFSADGTRSVRFTRHEMDFNHYHLEFWGVNNETGEPYRINIYQPINQQHKNK